MNDLMLSALLRVWPELAWHAGRFGTTVRVDGCAITMPSRYLAGVLRLGGYESAERTAVRKWLPRELPLIELGAGVGVVACLANRRLFAPQRHLCVDGNPRALQQAIVNGRQNGCLFYTLHAAIAYDTPIVSFGMDDNIVSGGIESGHERITAPTITLARLLDEAGFARASLICDIEGAEQTLLEREADVLRERVPWLMLETHPQVYGKSGERSIDGRLSELGYRQRWRRRDVAVWTR
jgi:FkbM family methyltransferase